MMMSFLINLKKKANILTRSNPEPSSDIFLISLPYNISQASNRYFSSTVKIAGTFDEKIHSIIRERK